MELINSDNSSEPLPLTPVVLLLLDGWGISQISEANAIASAKTPTFLDLIKEYPVALLEARDKTVNARYLSLGSGQDLSDENIGVINPISKVISVAGLKQIKITETERLAALTHFFNGHSETKFIGEDWKIVSSKAGDHEVGPSLVANRISKELLDALKTEKYNFIVVAMPALDLVAKSGDLKMIKKTIEAVDKNLKKIVEAVLNKKGILVISAAGGNAENMKSMATDLVDKEITNNPVPLIIIGEDFKGKTIGLSEPLNDDLSLLAPAGNLGDLAPTILDIMNLPKPKEMEGNSLIDKN
jgi:2,3-bisphosphoglycerate-independent phosphoglycerate mutase